MSHFPIDLKKLLTDGDVHGANTIWLVEFRGRFAEEQPSTEQDAVCPDCGVAHDPQRVEAEITVLGGEDAQTAIEKARNHAQETGLTDFILRGVHSLAEADII